MQGTASLWLKDRDHIMSFSQCQASLAKGFPFCEKMEHQGGFRGEREIPREKGPAEEVWAWKGVQDKKRGHSFFREKRKTRQHLTRREEQQRGGGKEDSELVKPGPVSAAIAQLCPNCSQFGCPQELPYFISQGHESC